jgi:hypothetical protein
MANISTRALFIQHGKYPQVTNVSNIPVMGTWLNTAATNYNFQDHSSISR